MTRSSWMAVLVLGFAGCAGYQIGPVKPKIMEAVHTIAVPSFKNDTLETRIEVLMASAIIKQLQQDGTYKVARDNEADAILQGTLVEIRRRPARSVTGNVLQTREYTLELRVKYSLVNRVTGKEIDGRTVSGTTSFFVSGSNTVAADVTQDERQALPIAAEDLAIRLVSQLSEGW